MSASWSGAGSADRKTPTGAPVSVQCSAPRPMLSWVFDGLAGPGLPARMWTVSSSSAPLSAPLLARAPVRLRSPI